MNQQTDRVVKEVLTGIDGFYRFAVTVPRGTYKVVETQPAGMLDGKETAGTLGGSVDNSKDSNEIGGIVVPPVGTTDPISSLRGEGYFFGELKPSRLQGLVWEDFNNDGSVDFGERAIGGVEIRLTGSDDRGKAVDQVMETDVQGTFEFVNLRPSSVDGYTLTETQPADYLDGREVAGTVDGVISGQVADNVFSQIAMTQSGSDGINYNFGERPASDGRLGTGQTATIGFWQNKHGQALIKASTTVQMPHS